MRDHFFDRPPQHIMPLLAAFRAARGGSQRKPDYCSAHQSRRRGRRSERATPSSGSDPRRKLLRIQLIGRDSPVAIPGTHQVRRRSGDRAVEHAHAVVPSPHMPGWRARRVAPDDRLYPTGQGFHREWLSHQVHTRRQSAPADCDTLSVTGDEEHWQFRAAQPGSIGHLTAIQAPR